MAKQKLSVEDILGELEQDSQVNKNSLPDGKLETHNLVNSAQKLADKNNSNSFNDNDIPSIVRNHSKSNRVANDGPLRRPNPANDFKPSDISRQQISFLNSIDMDKLRVNNGKNNTDAYDSAMLASDIDDSHIPKIRRMSNSSRAKEIEKNKKKRGKKTKSNLNYKKESPDGIYMYTGPNIKKKKRKISVEEEALTPEHKKEITDIVPSPQSISAPTAIKPAPRASMTSINLSEDYNFDVDSLDIHIESEPDDYKKHTSKRTKRIVDFNYYGDVEDVGRDIYDLKNTISVRTTILLSIAVLSCYMSLSNTFSLPILDFINPVKNIIGFASVQLILMIIAIFSSISVITNGLKKFITFKSDSDSMTAITALLCLISNVIFLFTPQLIEDGIVHVCSSIGILALLLNSIGKTLIINRAMRNFKFVSKDFERHGITCVQDDSVAETLTRGTIGNFPILASMRKTDFLTDFLKYTYSSDISDKFCKRAVPICFSLSLVLSFVFTFLRYETFSLEGLSFGMSLFTFFTCATSCISLPLVVNIPLDKASRTFIKNDGIILGYQSVDDFYDTNSILIKASDLFPENSIKLAGIKVFSDTKIDVALLEAASITHHADSVMKGLFNDVIVGKEEMLHSVENFSYEDSLGLCGWINNKRVLFGSRELMTSHNIEGIPTKAKENELITGSKEAVYLSISGNLAAMFVVEIIADPDVKKWFNHLDKNNIFLIIKSVDSCITLKRLSKLFDVPEDIMRVIPQKLHRDFDEHNGKSVRLSASMACSGKFSSLVQLITATKSIYALSVLGLIIQTVSILLGFALTGMLVLSKSFEYSYMSISSLLIYNSIATLLTLIAVNLKKFK